MMSSVGYTNAVNIVSLKRCGGRRWTGSGLPSFVAVARGAGSPPTTGSGGGGGGVGVYVAAEQLRTQLGQLQAESEAARSKEKTSLMLDASNCTIGEGKSACNFRLGGE
ncbi:hypothetical protein Taro_037453, partial [Colocasia esculenta]|nr:hypothetical protein [Colocasia esculenta]